jgi:DNA-binding NarL/FixJ family response regulator
MTRRPRILIGDDHQLVGEALKHLLESEFDVIGIANDGRSLVDRAAKLHPDVVIADISMPLLNGLEAGERIKQLSPPPKLIFVTMNASPEIAADAFRRGASAFVVKQSTAQDLVIAVRRVLNNQSYLSPLITQETVEFLLRSGGVLRTERQLTARQAEILQLLAEGKAMKEVAYILNIKQGTVAFHKYKIMEALGVNSNAALIQYAIRNRVVA